MTALPAAVAPRGRLLAVHAHPDDETLATGALLATWAAAGQPVTVVTCTRGERGETIGDDLAALEGDPAALAAHRERELAAALAALGVTDHLFLDQAPGGPGGGPSAPGGPSVRFEDSGMAWLPGQGRVARAPSAVPPGAFVSVGLDDAAGRLAALIDSTRPSVVVTYEPGGGYGHPDHVRAHEVTVRALRLCRPEARPQHVWFRVVPRALHLAALAAVRACGTSAALDRPGHRRGLRLPAEPDRRGPFPPQVVTGPADVVVDVRPVLGAVVAALRAHRSQVQAVRTWPSPARTPEGEDLVLGSCALSDGELLAILAHEHYVEARDGVPSEGR